MKTWVISFLVLSVLGVGCVGNKPDQGAPTASENVYQNTQYGFNFVHPTSVEVRVREDGVRQSEYVGLAVDFFVSVRDTEREDKPVNLAFFYAAPGLTTEAFTEALKASDPAITVKSTEEVVVNNLTMTKIVSTTAIEIDKTHYLFEGTEGSTVVISVFLNEEANFQPILDSLRKL